MSDKRIYTNSIGTEIILDTGVAIGSATVVNIQVQKPDGTTAQWDATVFEATKAKHVIASGELDVPGDYDLQVYVEMAVFKGRSTTVTMPVYQDFK